MESINLACSFIKPGDFMASLDLKDAYFSIPIFQPHRKYLRFLWKGQRYEFTCLPFGYSLAPRVFTKVLKPVIATLRFRGIRLVVFIDDILVIASSAQQCSDHLAEALALLRSLGFTINFKKSNLTPVSNIIYLGFLINSVSMKLFLPEDKISKVILACQQLVSSTKPTVRMVAHVTGLLVSAFPAVKFLRLYYRSLEQSKTEALNSESDYDNVIALSQEALEDLHWIINNISAVNGTSFAIPAVNLYIESDASLTGWGAVYEDHSASGRWTVTKSTYHINYLELLAVFLALQSFVSSKRSIHVRVALDNTTAVAYINAMGGMKSPYLNSLTKSIWQWCIDRDIHISAQHIPGRTNVSADFLSRNTSGNLEWSLNDSVYQQLTRLFFIPEVDLFASRLNAKAAQFVSWHPQPGAFKISWFNLKCYAFPPFSLLSRVLAKIYNDRATVLLIAPVWSTQGWFPMLLQLLVRRPILLPRNNLLTLPHSLERHPLADKLTLAAWMESGDPSETAAFLQTQSSLCAHLGPLEPKNSTVPPGRNGVAGVVNGTSIFFRRLSTK